MPASDAHASSMRAAKRPLLLAKVSPTELLAEAMGDADSSGDLITRHIAAIAAPNLSGAARPDAGEVTRGMLAAALSKAGSAPALVTKAASVIRRNLGFDFAGAYLVEEGQADRLTLLITEGLPAEFGETARMLPLWDFGDIADMPYNGDRPPCYGDFFAPVAAAFGMRAWLVASLADPLTTAVRGALLLGSRDPRRFDAVESARVVSLAETVSAGLADRFPQN